MPPRAQRAFSLIELLVTMAVIALLLGILLPVLPHVRDAARRTACASNQRQIGIAIESYKGDYREQFPYARYMPNPWPSSFNGANPDVEYIPTLPEALADGIEPFSTVYKCPGDRAIFDIEYTDDDGVTRKGGSSYPYQTILAGVRFDESRFVEHLHFTEDITPVLTEFDGGEYVTNDGSVVFTDFFHSTRNILFADGHVGKFKGDFVNPGTAP